jgi:hypothetical protein
MDRCSASPSTSKEIEPRAPGTNRTTHKEVVVAQGLDTLDVCAGAYGIVPRRHRIMPMAFVWVRRTQGNTTILVTLLRVEKRAGFRWDEGPAQGQLEIQRGSAGG